MITAVDETAGTGTTDDAARWAEATRIAGGRPATQPLADERRRRTRWRTLLGIVGLSALVGGLVAFLLTRGDQQGPEADAPVWREVLGLGISGAGLVLAVAGGVVAWRAEVLRSRHTTQPESVLTPAQVRGLYAQLRGRAPVVPEQLPVTRHLAARQVQLRRLFPLWSGMVVLQTGLLIAADDLLAATFPVLSGLCFAFLLVALVRRSGQASEFLRRHPEPADSAG